MIHIVTWKKGLMPKASEIGKRLKIFNVVNHGIKHRPEVMIHPSDYMMQARNIVNEVKQTGKDWLIFTTDVVYFSALRAAMKEVGGCRNMVYFYVHNDNLEPETAVIDNDGRIADWHDCFEEYDDILSIIL